MLNTALGTFHIGIYVFDDVEVLDFAGPYEVFTTASRMHVRDHLGSELFCVYNLSEGTQATPEQITSVRARAGLRVLPDADFTNHVTLDVLIVPGGVVAAAMAKPHVIDWIRHTAAHTKMTASVCTGAFLLAKAGLLAGKRVTTHWEDIDDLRAMFPTLIVEANTRWVDEGNIVTSAGISAGIDMSLHLVERLAGRELALRTAHQMEFDWTENQHQASI